MHEDAIFRLASMTKPLVAVTALRLVEEGKLGLEDPVTKYLPEFRPKLADGREPVITVRQLLTHTAGLNYSFLEPLDGPYHRANVSDGMDQPGLGMEENLRRLASVSLLFEPGTEWHYSLAIDVLGAVLERAAGETLPEVVAKNVTMPLGMTDTAFAARDRARLAVPYADGTPKPVRMAEPHLVKFGDKQIVFSPARICNPASFPSGGAGMNGTAKDYLAFLEALRTGGGKILKPESVRMLTTNQIGDLRVTIEANPGWGFSLGFAILRDPTAAKSPHSAGSWQWAAHGETIGLSIRRTAFRW